MKRIFLVLAIILVASFSQAAEFKLKKSEAVKYSLFPGLLLHGSGHYYAQDWMGATELFTIELFSLYCFSKANTNPPDSVPSYLKDNSRQIWTNGWNLAGGLLFVGSWLYDLVQSPNIVDGRYYLNNGEHSESMKLLRHKRLSASYQLFLWSFALGIQNIQPESYMLAALGIFYFADWMMWEERFFPNPNARRNTLNFYLSPLAYNSGTSLNVAFRF